MIYVDSSVMLAELFAEERRVASSFWQQDLVSSRLLEYEVWNRIHVRKLAHIVGDRARLLFQYVSFYEMSPVVLARALTPFPYRCGLSTPCMWHRLHTPAASFRQSSWLATTKIWWRRRMLWVWQSTI